MHIPYLRHGEMAEDTCFYRPAGHVVRTDKEGCIPDGMHKRGWYAVSTERASLWDAKMFCHSDEIQRSEELKIAARRSSGNLSRRVKF